MLNIIKKLNIFIIIVFVFIVYNNIFAASIIGLDKRFYKGPNASQYKKIVVTGDSYAGLFNDFESNKDLEVESFALAGNTVIVNKQLMIEACQQPTKFILISVGVNDHFSQTTPYMFESTLRECLAYACSSGKIVFMHSYVAYPASFHMNTIYKTNAYDNVIKRLTREIPNVYYIDMHDKEGLENIGKDALHYGVNFYDALYNRVYDCMKMIEEIENQVFGAE